MFKTISREALASHIKSANPPILIEALPARYYLDAHLPGAINIPHDEIETRAQIVLPNKAAAIVTYCANTSCQNSGMAARTLDRLGYSNVFEYVEGKEDWIAAGLPTVSVNEETVDAA
jgi:rhodanese-related sulfurtransferase